MFVKHTKTQSDAQDVPTDDTGGMIVFLCVLRTQNSKKTGKQTYLLLTYDRQFRSPISLEAHLLTFTYESIYDTYIV